jgi:hypothetical protein
MSRRIGIRFLNTARTRAEVIITYTPSWFGRLFGKRAEQRTTVVAYDDYEPYPNSASAKGLTRIDWIYEVDRRALSNCIDDIEIRNAIEWRRRWSTMTIDELPQARLVKRNE